MKTTKAKRADERNSEIVSFFYAVFSQRIHSGKSQDDARKEAYDAVTLRYDISRGRLLNIVSEQKNSRNINAETLRLKALALIDELQVANKGMESYMQKNERLISILKDCVGDDNR